MTDWNEAEARHIHIMGALERMDKRLPDLDEALEKQLQELGFCGCGNPESAAEFLRGGMQLIADQRKGPHYTRNAGRFDPEFEQWCKDHTAAELAHFGSRGAAYFFYYWLADNDLEEHGGSVPGWLTGSGEELLSKLTAWCADGASCEQK